MQGKQPSSGIASTASLGAPLKQQRSSRRHGGLEDSLAAAEAGRQPQERRCRDDAPMTPVVYLVLWTSVVVGALRGYALNATIAARWSPAVNYALSRGAAPAAQNHTRLARELSPYCSSSPDGLQGIWYAALLAVLLPCAACILGAVFIRCWGRTRGVMLGSVAAIVGQVLTASATSMAQLAVAMATVQAASSVLSMSIVLQTVEVAPRARRGAFLLIHMFGIALGTTLVTVIGYVIAAATTLGWRLLLGMGVIPALAVLLVMPWMVDTPQSLIERGKYAEGLAALRDIRGPFYEDTYGEYMSIVAAAAAAPKGFMMYAELFRSRRHLPAICTGMVMALLAVQLDPQSRSFVAYNTLIRADVAPKEAILMTTLTLALAYALATVVAMLLVDRVGRLPLLRISSLLGVTVVAVLAVGGTLLSCHAGLGVRGEVQPAPGDTWPFVSLGVLGVLSAGNGLAWSSVIWVIIAESQALAVRPAGLALCMAVANLSASVLEAQLLCLLKVAYYIFLLCISFLALSVAWCLVPETSKVSLENITDIYLRHWFWRRVIGPTDVAAAGIGGSGHGAAAIIGGIAGKRSGSGEAAGACQQASASAGQLSDGSASRRAGSAFAAAAGAPLEAAAAPADAAHLHRSPFGRSDAQQQQQLSAARSLGVATLNSRAATADDRGRNGSTPAALAAAAAAAAARAASLPGGAGSGGAASGQLRPAASSSGGGSGGLGAAWSLRGPGWLLGGRRRSSQAPHHLEASLGCGTLDQLVEELREGV